MRFAIPIDFDYFKHLVCLYEVKEDLIVKGERVVLCSRGAEATYKLSDISLEYMFGEHYAKMVDVLCGGTIVIP